PGGTRVEDLIFADQTECKRVDQRIAGVARLEFRLTAEVRYSEAVAVGGDATDDAVEDGVVAVDFSFCGDSRRRLSGGAQLRCRPLPLRLTVLAQGRLWQDSRGGCPHMCLADFD